MVTVDSNSEVKGEGAAKDDVLQLIFRGNDCDDLPTLLDQAQTQSYDRRGGGVVIHAIHMTILKDMQTFTWKSGFIESFAAGNSILFIHLQKLLVRNENGSRDMAMPVSVLRQLLLQQTAPNLTELILRGVGFRCGRTATTDQHDDDYEQLEAACREHTCLSTVRITDMYTTSSTGRWMHFSLLVTALSKLPVLSVLQMSSVSSATTTGSAPGYSRPVLTMCALQSLFTAPLLRSLQLQHVLIWGGGAGGSSSSECADGLRRNTSLQTLALQQAVFCHGSVLAGLDENSSVVSLDLTGSLLHAQEAEGLAAALFRTSNHRKSIPQLQRVSFHGARFGVSNAEHEQHLCRVVLAVAKHPVLTVLDLRRCNNRSDIADQTDGRSSSTAVLTLLETVVVEVLQTNRVLTEVHMDDDSHVNSNNDTDSSTVTIAAAQIALSLGLNRAGYWALGPRDDRVRWWAEKGFDAVNSNIDCLFYLLSNNPMLCIRTPTTTTAVRPEKQTNDRQEQIDTTEY